MHLLITILIIYMLYAMTGIHILLYSLSIIHIIDQGSTIMFTNILSKYMDEKKSRIFMEPRDANYSDIVVSIRCNFGLRSSIESDNVRPLDTLGGPSC